ncbi:MAG: thioredoxin family protein [Xanthobacteraceae bacterium]|nr:thioredoxin family protein [Xanthobacteraceae bacterium]QYK45552.1 MAG: thioredoxin family protein [Xanthobacteraceae bacterium]HMN51282.1 thioredoxin family protein [Xanthobacteraceae bacterium]
MHRRAFVLLAAAATAAPLFGATNVLAKAFSAYQAESFKKLLAAGGPVVVHVHAEWCPVCHAQIPVMARVLAQPAYRNVQAVRVNFDTDKMFLTDFKVVRQSTIVIYKGGKEIARLSYDTDPARIEQTLERAIS